jgi:hypothetical protein
VERHRYVPNAPTVDAYDEKAVITHTFPDGAHLSCASGPSISQLPDEVEPIPLPAGRYRVRVAYAQTDHRPATYNPADSGDHLEYQLTMWPTDAELGVHVLKQGPSPWAY